MNRKTNSNGRFTLLVSVIACLGVLALSGCGPEEDKSSTGTNPPQKTQPVNYVDTIELRPDGSDEFQRIHRSLPNGTKVSMRIDYRDGSSKLEAYRPDGTIFEVREFHAVVNKLKSVTEFNGKGEAVSSKSYRISGVLESETEFLPDSAKKVTMYRIDGKRLHSQSIEPEDGTKSTTYFRKDGQSLWAKAEWHSSREVTVEYFDQTGKLSQVRELDSNNRDVTVYDASGRALYKQYWDGYWNPNSSYYYYQSYQLESVEELEADGKTIKRRIHVERYSNNRVKSVEYFEDGTLVREQELNYDGSVKTEKVLKEDGTWSNETTTAVDPIDKTMFDEPDYQDPLTNAPNNFL